MGLLAVSSLAPRQISFQLTGTGPDQILLVPTGGLFIVKSAVVVNVTNDPNLQPTAFTVLVTVSKVPSGADISDAGGIHRVMTEYPLAPGDVQRIWGLIDTDGDPLGPGDAIWARADIAPGASQANGAVNVKIGGWLGS